MARKGKMKWKKINFSEGFKRKWDFKENSFELQACCTFKCINQDCIMIYYQFKGFMIGHCGLEVRAWSLSLKVVSSSLLLAKFTFFQLFSFSCPSWGVWGSNHGQKWHLHGSPRQPWDLLPSIPFIKLSMPYKGQVAESGGSRSNSLYFATFHT